MRLALINNVAERRPACSSSSSSPALLLTAAGKQGKTNTSLVRSQVDQHTSRSGITRYTRNTNKYRRQILFRVQTEEWVYFTCIRPLYQADYVSCHCFVQTCIESTFSRSGTERQPTNTQGSPAERALYLTRPAPPGPTTAARQIQDHLILKWLCRYSCWCFRDGNHLENNKCLLDSGQVALLVATVTARSHRPADIQHHRAEL